MRTPYLSALALCLSLAASARAADLNPALTPDNIDAAQCAAYVDGKEISRGSAAAVAAALGVGASTERWTIPSQSGKARQFTVGFKQPVALGTICTPTYLSAKLPLKPPEGRLISLLKPDAPYPGDIAQEEQWTVLPPGHVKPLPPGTTTRELRISDIALQPPWGKKEWETSLEPVVCLQQRYYAATEIGRVQTAATSPVPELVWASWNETQSLAGVVAFLALPEPVTVDTLKTTSIRPAPEADAADWEPRGGSSNPVLQITFTPPVATRAVRVTGPVFDYRRRAVVRAVCPLVAMGDRTEPPGAETPPPFKVAFTMPLNGFAAIDLHDKQTGALVRRLIGETARDQGLVQEGWDLRDEDGQVILPGQYTWKGIARPPFKLTYEMTAYNAGQPAWWAPAPGKGGGGWLGDHGSPNCVAAMGDVMWLGTFCAESGHAFIASDLEGNKLWGTGSLSYGFRGPSRVAADERCGYAMTDSVIARCDPKRDFKLRTIYTFREQPELPWYAQWGDVTAQGGFAARDGLLYCSVSAPERWLKSTFLSDDMDPAKSQPIAYLYKGKGVRKGKYDKNYDVYEYDELMLFYATFLTERNPAQTPSLADTPIPSTPAVHYGDAPVAGKLKGNLVVKFRKPVLVGSVLIPDSAVKVYALKPGVKYEQAVGNAEGDQTGMQDLTGKKKDDLGDNEEFAELTDDSTVVDWIELKTDVKPGHPTVAVAPTGGVQTTALRYKVKSLNFSQVMGHRLADVAPQAERVFTEGELTPQGGWRTVRKGRAVTEFVPAQVALVWPAEQELRGLTLFNPPPSLAQWEVARLEVDQWNGPASADPKASLADDSKWKLIGPYNVGGDPVVHQVDFGTTLKTRAVRIRFLSGAPVAGGSSAGTDAIVAYRPIGADPTNLPVMLNERITVLKAPAPENDEADATFVRHIPFPKPNNLAFDEAGTLYCLSDGQVVTVPLKDGETSRVVVTKDKLDVPVNLALDKAGQVYVTDKGPKVVKVFDGKTGALVKAIGTAGGPLPGKWDPSRLENPAAVTVDKDGKVWLADCTYHPKRIMCFGADGKPYKWFLGPTQYGGGGTMDSRNRGIVMYQGMKFTLDWAQRTWALEALLGYPVERTVYLKDQRYIVGPAPGGGEVALITYERDDKAVPVAAMGKLGYWSALKDRPNVRAKYGAMDPKETLFVWSDLNGNGVEDADEVQTVPMRPGLNRASWVVGEDLAMITEGFRLRPKEFKGQTPVYDLAGLETWVTHSHGPGARTNRPWEDEQGRIFMIGTRLIANDGQSVLWEYYNPFACHDGFYASGYGYNRPPGKLNQEHFPIAHFRLGKEEYFVNNTDQGDWFCYTADGMLAGCLFGGPTGYGLRQWTKPEWNPGKTDLTDLRLGQEHYQGCVVVPDGTNVYAVAGHNHMSIVRIDGLEQLTRMNGSVTVTPADLEKTREWQVQRDALRLARQEPKFAKILRTGRPPLINGTIEEWPEDLLVLITKTVKLGLHDTEVFIDGQGALAYDENNLYVAFRVRDESPLKNVSPNLSLLFKGGDAAEVDLGLDPGADAKRTSPRAGDMRLLFAVVKGRPVAMLYKPVDPDAPADKHATFTSPVGQNTMDRVEQIMDAKVAAQPQPYKDGMFWVLEASVPWKSLGVPPPTIGTKIRADLGYLQSDENGVLTVGRKYWSGKSQTVVCDIPSESRLAPALWGEMEFVKSDKTLRFVSSAASSLEDGTSGNLMKPKGEDVDVNELLGE